MTLELILGLVAGVAGIAVLVGILARKGDRS